MKHNQKGLGNKTPDQTQVKCCIIIKNVKFLFIFDQIIFLDISKFKIPINNLKTLYNN